MTYQPQQKPHVTPAVKPDENEIANRLYAKRVKIDRYHEDKALKRALREMEL